jgi:hypothetical protein
MRRQLSGFTNSQAYGFPSRLTAPQGQETHRDQDAAAEAAVTRIIQGAGNPAAEAPRQRVNDR